MALIRVKRCRKREGPRHYRLRSPIQLQQRDCVPTRRRTWKPTIVEDQPVRPYGVTQVTDDVAIIIQLLNEFAIMCRRQHDVWFSLTNHDS
jgi:hypothetical protein